ncbi:hypothetical protein BDK51DRAFT_36824, partial [Blyttiomyces helicus]
NSTKPDSIFKYLGKGLVAGAAARAEYDGGVGAPALGAKADAEPVPDDEAHSRPSPRAGHDSAAAPAATSGTVPALPTPDAVPALATPGTALQSVTQSVHRRAHKSRVPSGSDVRNFFPFQPTPAHEFIARRAEVLGSIEAAAAGRHISELLFQSVKAELIARRRNDGADAGEVGGKDDASALNGDDTPAKQTPSTDPDQTPRTSIAAPPRKIAQVSAESSTTVYGSQHDIDAGRRESLIVPAPAEAAPAPSRHLIPLHLATTGSVVDTPRVSDSLERTLSVTPSATNESAFEVLPPTHTQHIAVPSAHLPAPQSIPDPDRIEVIGRVEHSRPEAPPVVIPRLPRHHEEEEEEDEPPEIKRSIWKRIPLFRGHHHISAYPD